MHHHIRVLILRAFRTIALGIGVRRDVKNILLQYPVDVPVDIVAKAQIDLVQDIAAVVERLHLADSFVTDTVRMPRVSFR